MTAIGRTDSNAHTFRPAACAHLPRGSRAPDADFFREDDLRAIRARDSTGYEAVVVELQTFRRSASTNFVVRADQSDEEANPVGNGLEGGDREGSSHPKGPTSPGHSAPDVGVVGPRPLLFAC